MLCKQDVFTAHLLTNGWVVESPNQAYLKTKTEVISIWVNSDGSMSYEARTPKGDVYCKGFVMVGCSLDLTEIVSLNLMGFYPYIKNSGE